MIIIVTRLVPFGGRPAVGFGPKLEEMNPRTFPDLPTRPRTLDFDQKTSKATTNHSNEKIKKSLNDHLYTNLEYLAFTTLPKGGTSVSRQVPPRATMPRWQSPQMQNYRLQL